MEDAAEDFEHDIDLERERLEQQLEQAVSGNLAGVDLAAELDEEQEREADAVPNTVFVPLTVTPPGVNMREFVVYVILLGCFTYNIRMQGFDEDYQDRMGMMSRLNIAQWDKIQTVDQYVEWFPNLVSALNYWQDNQYDAVARGVTNLGHELWKPWTQHSGAQTPAVLVGPPVFTQVRCPPAAASGEATCVLEQTDHMADVKFGALKRMTQHATQGFSNADGSACRWDTGHGACYADTRYKSGAYEFYLRQNITHEILSGTIDWSPNLWIDPYTVELGHHFTIFIPSERRFTVARLKVHVDSSGGVTLGTLDIQTHEPFARGLGDDQSWSLDFVLELGFYTIMLFLFILELSDIMDCVFHSEMLVPLQIVSASLRLSLLEVIYFHEQSGEVYDPRDPTTGEAFAFPASDDLRSHFDTCVAPARQKISQLEAKMKAMKIKMAQAPLMRTTTSEFRAFHQEMRAIHVDLIAAELHMEDESYVAQIATMLQLAVLWKNHWQDDFEPGYLAALDGRTTAGQPAKRKHKVSPTHDGHTKFADIDWVNVARSYLAWNESFMGKGTGGAAASSCFEQGPISSAFLKQLAHDDADPQHWIFFELEQHVKYLDVIRNLIDLHDHMMIAFNIKYWDGPRGVDRSNTIERAYQHEIKQYNKTGTDMLKEMAKFPEEVQRGFAMPDAVKAEVIRTMGQALHEDLLDLLGVAGLLGFFFPGSPMWETRRRLRAEGLYKQSDGFFASFQNLDWGMVSSTSMDMYMGRDLELKIDKPVSGKGGTHTSNPMLASNSGDGDSPSSSPTASPKFASPLTQEELTGMSYNARHKAFETAKHAAAGNVSPGIPGWRKLITGPVRKRINYDGQFMTVQTTAFERSRKNQILARSGIYPLWLWMRAGLTTYLSDGWNALEMISYGFFMSSFYCKLSMHFGEADDLEMNYNQFLASMTGTNRTHPLPLDEQEVIDLTLDAIDRDISHFSLYKFYYLRTLVPTTLIMWVKLFKYFDIIPQMGLLTKVISAAGRPIMVFAIMAAMPCMGLALSYHTAFGQTLYQYSTIGKSFNSVLRVSMGDFNFQEIYSLRPLTAVSLFWTTALLIVFTLVNIFVAIILKSYEQVVNENPDANDSSRFFTMVFMQAKRAGIGALSGHSNKKHAGKPDATKPTILAEKTLAQMQPVDTDTYWSIFDTYFSLAGGPSAASTRTSRRNVSRFDENDANTTGKNGARGAVGNRRNGGDRVVCQVDELSVQMEALAKAQQGMENKIDALQTQQATIIQMLKKLT